MDINFLLEFLEDLEAHNNKIWMDKNRDRYLRSKNDFKIIVDQLIEHISLFDPQIRDLNAADCLFRINRNNKFSKGGPTYKPHFAATISKEGKQSPYAEYFLMIQPGNRSMIGAGIFNPDNEQLRLIRNEIKWNGKEFEEILNHDNFMRTFNTLAGRKLVRPPKGFDKEEEYIEYIKFKNFIVFRELKDHELIRDNFISSLIQYTYYLKNFNHFLNYALTVSDKKITLS